MPHSQATSTTFQLVDPTDATAKLISPANKVVTVIGNASIRAGFEQGCLKQIVNIADAPGIFEAVLNPDGHQGYGCPVGSVFASREMIYPNAVGPDVKCSMSFLQFALPAEALADVKLRRALIDAIEARIPTGPGSHVAKKARPFDDINVLRRVAIEGASRDVLDSLDIPREWAALCEDASHGDAKVLEEHLARRTRQAQSLEGKLRQLGGVGGGNHFLECNVVHVNEGAESIAQHFGLIDGHIGFLCHFGSRGFGFMLTSGGRGYPGQFRFLADRFNQWHIPFPGGDSHNVYVPLGSAECEDYLNDMYLGANFATINHLLICTYVLEAFREVLGKSLEAKLVYYIAHNIIRHEIVDKAPAWVHRKGATRALPAGHHELKGTKFYDTGHPILLPGNPVDGSTILVGSKGSRLALNSVNHGAGRRMSRRQAMQSFTQKQVNDTMDAANIITNCRQYPIDESPDAYKPYGEVIDSVLAAGLAKLVARLRPVMNIKDNDERPETSA